MDEEIFKALPQLLLPWYARSARDLPWRRDREPYHIWLSEIMLQQTRVEAVKGYYARFLTALPNIQALAAADQETVNKLWEGLGYYSRARNLHCAAKEIVERYQGKFPSDFAAIRALPGIGDYTAGAIGSIAFELPTPAVDGNVLRLVSRVTASRACVDDAKVKSEVRNALASIYPAGACGRFTQSLMELGATVCIPNGTPDCTACPLRTICRAMAQGVQLQLPVRREKRARRQEIKTVLILDCDGSVALQKRPPHGLLAGLWQLPEAPGTLSPSQALTLLESWGVKPQDILKQVEKNHIFTHVEWNMTGIYFRCAQKTPQFTWATPEELERLYSVPTAYRQFLTERTI